MNYGIHFNNNNLNRRKWKNIYDSGGLKRALTSVCATDTVLAPQK